MTDFQLKTPVALIIFNRPQTTEKVFEAIRQAKPPMLFVIADGPRADKPGEAEKCAAARAIIDRVDWDCQVLKNYSDTNMGCGKRPATGIDWVFDTVEEAIILEDDCVPHPAFFHFCEELLEHYRHDERVMTICGLNVQFGRKRSDYSYYFSRYNHCWGWASWRRAWQHFDYDINIWPEIRDNDLLMDMLGDARTAKVWHQTLERTYEERPDWWDFQWTFAMWLQQGLAILPNVNLISYVGYHPTESTHTHQEGSPYSNLAVEALDFPLKHPPYVIRDTQADHFTENSYYDYQPSFLKKVNRKLKKALGINAVT
ncbi:glycosyltransferase family 2 protein [Lusitaniella coriacea LEGE 07157]|uniref:Glycosyltransferase family 2 protein n=1 Tax=Lusitaniella coriacea LEGE 07157 TaxID=945747 RepID=A0A8J7DY64_9CYAN|nr:glycosyltransferase family 2 protein [Lusitaniella coriacea]MBE9116598.1 glycosyltransferase family 2 protein [Lusitaniella coriacea LEGE 07157]